MKKNILITAFSLLFLGLFSQDTIIQMNGKFINGKVLSADNMSIMYELNKNNKTKIKEMFVEDLFAIKYSDSISYFYSQDTLNGYFYSVDEMYSFVLGEYYARNYYKAPLSTIGGFITGFAGGIIGFWGFTIPTGYAMLTGSADPQFITNKPLPIKQDFEYLAKTPDVSIKSGYSGSTIITSPKTNYLLLEKPFYEGYNAQAKDKKTKNAVKGGILGFAALVATSYILLSLK
ncbi:MAG: hypothetical protein JXR58_05245 [Bacteroidales bacterium]|nr:hypothetical protein [Bacteroidales bacterium]